MNAKTREAIIRHGESLLLAFPNCTEKDPVALCKKLRRIETVTHKAAEDYSNGTADSVDMELARRNAVNRCVKLLGIKGESNYPVFVNSDPRGYALKLSDVWMMQHPEIKKDWGGYGILAPDLTA